ncbi:Rpp20 subunit of nuclear RNase MRP and P-domain-containing protein [Aspergillus multicolor]|uniref:ribonuclease P subunit p20 family protein n=1 Tax=Aspergillus multicolor TaxID=41759 RepID=UPI003CCD8D59
MSSRVQAQRQSTAKTQMADLTFERKNQDMVKLPKYARVTKRPIPHAPISSPYAGPSIPKTIYISSSTPYMSAVKRVQKLLRHAEKRATASLANKTKKNNKNWQAKKLGAGEQNQQERLLAALARGEEREQLCKEEVFVKATGKAMGVAVKVGKWFERGGREAEFKVRVTTGSVLVVDDVEEDEGVKEGLLRGVGQGAKENKAEAAGEGEGAQGQDANAAVSENKGDETTTMLGDITIMTETEVTKSSDPTAAPAKPKAEPKPLSKSALRKRKRAATTAASLAETELPETRTRWVNSVEVAISLK